MAVGQPLYAVAKQMSWSNAHGEDKYFVIFEILHIEIAALRALGSWLQVSGWVPGLMQTKIAISGTVDSFLKVSHVTQTIYGHQVTAVSLSILKHKTYQGYTADHPDDELELSFEDWHQKSISESPLFQYWSLTLKLQLILSMFLRA